MRAISNFLNGLGFRLGVPTDFVPELLVPGGILTKRAPNEAQWRDIRYGFRVAKELGRFDVGQSVLVANGVVIAVEAVEGTDLCIERAGMLCQKGGLILVKTAKPEQDMRFDVPTIGLRTLELFAKAGGRVVAIEADKTILIDENETIDFANQHGIVICAVRDGEAISPVDVPSA